MRLYLLELGQIDMDRRVIMPASPPGERIVLPIPGYLIRDGGALVLIDTGMPRAVLAGAAGLRIGYALVAPGPRRRGDALRAAARPAVYLLYGAAAMTACAALVEAFWSPQRAIPSVLKYGVGIGLWATWLLYFAFAGASARSENVSLGERNGG